MAYSPAMPQPMFAVRACAGCRSAMQRTSRSSCAAAARLDSGRPPVPSDRPGYPNRSGVPREPLFLPQLSLHSPVGDLTISEDGGVVVAVDWGWVEVQEETPLLMEARRQLHDYFDGARIAFDLPLAPQGTLYQKRVWLALCEIPCGATRTYAEIAKQIGGSPRAVGGANGRNPIPIIIPCHRVVATTGIGGYSGGEGLPTKRFLLALEGADADPRDLFSAQRA